MESLKPDWVSANPIVELGDCCDEAERTPRRTITLLLQRLNGEVNVDVNFKECSACCFEYSVFFRLVGKGLWPVDLDLSNGMYLFIYSRENVSCGSIGSPKRAARFDNQSL
jgi:hypothetical protein